MSHIGTTVAEWDSMKLSLLPLLTLATVGVAAAACANASEAPSASQASTSETNDDATDAGPPPINLPYAQAARTVSDGDTPLFTWSDDLWTGTLDFDAIPTPSDAVSFKLVDGAGKTTKLDFERQVTGMRMPVTLIASSNFGGTAIVQVKNRDVHIDGTNTSFKKTFALRATDTDATSADVATLGSIRPGVTLKFSAAVAFTPNFDAPPNCALAVTFEDASHQNAVHLQGDALTRDIVLVTPITVTSNVACITKRTDTIDAPKNDFDLELSNVAATE